MVHIRPVEPADVPRWAELRAALWPEEDPDALAAEAAWYFGDTVPTLDAVLVAEEPTQGVVGFAELSRRGYAEGCATSPVGFLEGWYVSPAFRRRGVGRALVAAAEAWARACGCREFASDTEVANTASAAAHRALGFEEVAVIRCFRKPLDPGPGG
jgi:aminoglycoside 6'-N-acetyltransferase I